MKNQMPVGYYVLDITDDNKLIIGMDHGHIAKECAPEITFSGITYAWGPLGFVLPEHPSFVAIVREYHAITEEGGQRCLL
tara:strand:- start:187 stop:426 length:240 start_codon:yes stop_codon:yes gene_type:complete